MGDYISKNVELKPCPFCGRSVTIKKRCLKDWKGEVVQRFYRIACSCGAGTHKEYKTEKAVKDVWNRRYRASATMGGDSDDKKRI